MQKIIKILIISISALLFAASLTQCAFGIDRADDNCWSSLAALLTGWLNPAGAGIAWYANPLLLVACIVIFKNEKLSVLLGFAACVFALSFLLFKKIITDEAGHYSNITYKGAGYRLWLSSCLSFLIGSSLVLFYCLTSKVRMSAI
jgi:hypothetical protein